MPPPRSRRRWRATRRAACRSSRRRWWIRRPAAVQVSAPPVLNRPGGRGGGRGDPLTADEQALVDRGAGIYNELCFACHGPDGFGTPKPELSTTMAPALAGSPRDNGHRHYIVKAILPRADGALRQQDLHRREDADGNPERRVGRRDRIVRPAQLRQHRRTGRAG